MKTEKSLEEKLNEIKIKLPGVKKQLEPYKYASWGTHADSNPQDVEYLETERYQIVAVKWEEDEWSEDGGGIKWTEWLSLHYKEKGTKDKIKKIETEKIVTRDQFYEDRDRKWLWPYKFVGVKSLGPALIEVAWVDENGNKGLTYQRDLK